MIEFNGDFSQKKQNDLAKLVTKQTLLRLIVLTIIFSIIILILAFVWSMAFLIMVAYVIVACFIYALTVYLRYRKGKALYGMLPKKISVDSCGNIKAEWKNTYILKKYFDIRKIVDFDEYYCIYFKPFKGNDIFCQKNLLTQGTIEDFERIFEDKIVRKTK